MKKKNFIRCTPQLSCCSGQANLCWRTPVSAVAVAMPLPSPAHYTTPGCILELCPESNSFETTDWHCRRCCNGLPHKQHMDLRVIRPWQPFRALSFVRALPQVIPTGHPPPKPGPRPTPIHPHSHTHTHTTHPPRQYITQKQCA